MILRALWRSSPSALGVPQFAGTRFLSATPHRHQFEALGVLVDAAEKANEEMEESKDGKRAKKRIIRAPRPPNGGGNGGGNGNGHSNKDKGESVWKKRLKATFVKATEATVIMTAGLAMLGFAGLVYHRAYRHHTLNKMDNALEEWDPVLQMSCDYKKILSSTDWVQRPQQSLVDDIVAGKKKGRYYILLGEKGTGKTSMILRAIEKVQGHNVVVMDAHGDPEIFRQRLGKALSFEFHEDYWGGLFSLRGPRENTFLDIERVFNVLEEVAVRRYNKLGRPLCLLINNAHLIHENEEGDKVLTLLQQKAESLSGSGIATIIFNSDDYWLYQRLMRNQTRMDAISISDLNKPEAVHILRRLRKSLIGEDISENMCNTIYSLVGGRPQHLAAVAGHIDMIRASQELIDRDKQWFLNNCPLIGGEMDDDVMDSGKFAVAGMLLAREFVLNEEELSKQYPDSKDGSRKLPLIPLWRAKQIMTRPDFIREFDNLNFFTLDSFSRVKPDSVVMMHAFREIVNMPGFEELLQSTMDRIDDIESLGRTRELCFKDLGGGGGRLRGSLVLKGNRLELAFPKSDDDDDESEEAMMLDRSGHEYWQERMRAIDREKGISK